MRNRHLYILTAVLTVAGLAIFYYKAAVLGLPLQPEAETPVWTVEARLRFRASAGPVIAAMRIPGTPPGFAILDENFVSRGYGLTTRQQGSNREVVWATRRGRSEQMTLYYRVVVFRDPQPVQAEPAPAFPQTPQLGQPYDAALETLVTDVRAQSANVATFTAEMLRRINEPNPDEEVELFLGRSEGSVNRAELASLLLAGARIPTRIAHGILLEDEDRAAEIKAWLEVHNGKRWLFFDPLTGQQGMPSIFLVWWRGTEPLVEVDGGSGQQIEIAVRRSQADAFLVAESRAVLKHSKALEFSALGLPIATQTVYQILLLIPVGAFVMVLMRNVIGVKTFGTFMPVLIALAFRETQLLYGIILFTLIVTLGLAIRFYLERLQLLLVPRLASVLIVVVLLMLGVSIFSHRLDLQSGLSVALFPMVIMTMVIERMSIVWEERGPVEAIQEGIGSLFVAALAYLVMGIDAVVHVFFVFPELLLVLLAIMLLLGRYSGYRLLELLRFKTLRA